jgi:hypothetical protein
MARVIAEDVNAIFDNQDSIEVTPFIDAANALVTEILGSSALTTAHLKEIERWLAAHFIAVRDPRFSRVKIGGAEATFQGRYGLGLEHTSYGQQVLALDTTGKLANLAKARASFAVISTT